MHFSSTLLGAAVFVALMIGIARSHSLLWRKVSACYGRPIATSIATRFGTVVLAPMSGIYRHHSGTFIGVSPEGLSFSVIPIPPLNTFCPPFFLPFEDMRLEPTSWGLWPGPFAIRTSRLPGLDIILGRDTVEWLRQQRSLGPFGLAA